MEEDKWRNLFNFRLINQVCSQISCASSMTFIQDYMGIHYLDRAVVNVSIRLAQDLMVYRLLGNIRVSMNKIDMQQ